MFEFLKGRVDPIGNEVIEASGNLATGLSPIDEAEFIKVSESTGIDAEVLRKLSPQQFKSFKNQKVVEQIPEDSRLRDYFRDPSAFAVSSEDVGVLNKIYDSVVNFDKTAQGVMANVSLAPEIARRGADIGMMIAENGKQEYQGMWGKVDQVKLDQSEKQLEAAIKAREALGYYDDVLPFIAGSTGETVGQMGAALTQGKTGGYAATAVAGTSVLLAAMALTPATGGASAAAIPTGKALLTAAATGGYAGMVQDAFEIEAGHAYAQFRKLKDINGQPLNPEIAKAAALAVGTINAGLEASLGATAIKLLGQLTPGSKAALVAARQGTRDVVAKALLSETVRARIGQVLTNYGKGIVAEGANEVLQEITPIIIEEIAKAKSNESGDNYFQGVKTAGQLYGALDEKNLAAYGEVFAKSAAGAGGVGAPVAVMKATHGAIQANRALSYLDKITEIREQVKTSKTLETSEPMMKRALKTMGFDQQAVVSPKELTEIFEAFGQEGLSRLNITEKEYQTAIEKNEDLAVEIADVTVLKDDEQFKFIAERLRGEIDEQTAKDAKEFDPADEMKNAVNVVEQMSSEMSEFNKQMERVTKVVKTVADKKGWDNDYASTVSQTLESFALRHAITEKQDAADFISRLDVQDLTDQIELAGRQPQGMEQAAFHGTPHTFQSEPGFPHGRFRLDKMGTGEGAQAFGWGVYFAESPSIAGSYYDTFKRGATELSYSDEVRQQILDADPTGRSFAAAKQIIGEYSSGGAVEAMRKRADKAEADNPEWSAKSKDVSWVKGLRVIADKMEAGELTADNRASLYTLDIPDEVLPNMLDLDATFNEQTPEVQKALLKFKEDAEGGEFYTAAVEQMGGAWDELTGMSIQELIQIAGKNDELPTLPEEQKRELSDKERASLYLKSIGIPGASYFDNPSRKVQEGTKNFVIWDQDVLDRTALLERNMVKLQSFDQAASRRVTGRTTVEGNKYFVSLFADANLSTLLHELGHVFLSEMELLEEKGVASKRMKSDLAKLKTWFNTGKNKGVNYQEVFARGFEKYLMNGTAPTVELRTSFERYRDWLKSVYKTVRGIGDQAGFEVSVTEEVAEVFDRMLATDEQIDAAAMDMDMVITAKDLKTMGVTTEEETNLKNLLSSMRKNASRRLQWEKERAAQIRETKWKTEAQELAKKEKALVARDTLKQKPVDADMLKKLVGKSAMEAIQKKRIGLFKKGTNVNPEIVAVELGYGSVDEMVVDLVDAPSKAEFIKTYVDEARAKYEGSALSAAEALVSEDKSAEYMEAAGKLLARMARLNQDQRSARALKQWADRQLGEAKVQVAASPNEFIRKFRGAMTRHKVAFRKGDYVSALKELNLAREEMAKAQASRAAKQFVERKDRALKKRANSKKKIDPLFRNHMVQLLNHVGITHKTKAPAPEITLAETIKQFFSDDESGVMAYEPPTPPSAWARPQIKNYRKELTLNEFREVVAFAEWLYKFGERLVDGSLLTMEGTEAENVQKLMEAMTDLNPKTPWFWEGSKPREWDEDMSKALAHMLPPDALFRILDGYRPDGTHTNLFWRGISRQLDAMGKHLDKLQAQMKPFTDYLVQRSRQFPEHITKMNSVTRTVNGRTIVSEVPPLPKVMQEAKHPWTFSRLVMIALNQGNEYNKAAVLDGYGLTQEQVDKFLVILDDKDWDVIEKIADVIESQWGMLKSTYEKINLVTPQKVKGDAFTTLTGRKMEGWYFPLKFDPDLSLIVDERAEINGIMDSLHTTFFAPKPNSSALIQRRGTAGLPVSLDIRNIASHLEVTSLYGFMAPILTDIDRLTRRPEYRKMVVDKFGKARYKLIRPYLQDIARGGRSAMPSRMQAYVGQTRAMVSAANLGYKLMVAAKQFTSYLTFLNRFGVFKGIKGTMDYYLNPIQNFRTIQGMSAYMMKRGTIIDETMTAAFDIANKPGMGGKVLELAQKGGYSLIVAADAMITFPAWHAAFQDAMSRNLTEAEAIAFADDMVALTQPSGRLQDKSAFQRDTAAWTILLNFFRGWSIKYTNELMFHLEGFGRGKISTTELVRFMAMEAIMAPVLTKAVTVALRREEPEPDDFLAEVMNYQVAGLPVIGETVQMVSKVARKEYTSGVFDTPLTQAASQLLELTRNVLSEDEDNANNAAWSLAKIMSFIIKVPVVRLYEDIQEGRKQYADSQDLRSLLFPNPKLKERKR